MSNSVRRVVAFLRRHNYVYHHRYDTEGSIHPGDNAESPKFSYAFKGNFDISIGRIIGFFAAIIAFFFTAFSVFSFVFTSLFSVSAFSGVRRLRQLRRRRKNRRRAKQSRQTEKKKR